MIKYVFFRFVILGVFLFPQINFAQMENFYRHEPLISISNYNLKTIQKSTDLDSIIISTMN